MERPAELIRRIQESAWDDGVMTADEFTRYFDEVDAENASTAEEISASQARIADLEAELAKEHEKITKLIDQNYNLVMRAGAVDVDESGGVHDDTTSEIVNNVDDDTEENDEMKEIEELQIGVKDEEEEGEN